MADSENTAPRSRFGWLPKLILWSVVIAFGYLYLHSIDQQEGDSSKSLLEKISELSPIPISALPGLGFKSTPATQEQVVESPVQANPVAEQPVSKVADTANTAVEVETAKVQDSQPANQAESSVFANSLMNKDTSMAPAAGQQAAVAPPKAPAMQQQVPVAMTPPSAPANAQPAPPVPAASTMMAPENRFPQAQGAPYDWDAMARQQAQMQTQYEAMRREADERMRQYWERMRDSGPTMPYGYPGYPAGYGPGATAPQR